MIRELVQPRQPFSQARLLRIPRLTHLPALLGFLPILWPCGMFCGLEPLLRQHLLVDVRVHTQGSTLAERNPFAPIIKLVWLLSAVPIVRRRHQRARAERLGQRGLDAEAKAAVHLLGPRLPLGLLVSRSTGVTPCSGATGLLRRRAGGWHGGRQPSGWRSSTHHLVSWQRRLRHSRCWSVMLAAATVRRHSFCRVRPTSLADTVTQVLIKGLSRQ